MSVVRLGINTAQGRIGAIFLLAVLVVGAFSLQAGTEPDYQTVVVVKRDVALNVAAVGTLKPRHSVDVGAQVSGQLLHLYADPGDQVEKGQLLAEIDASVYEAAVEADQAELLGLQAQLEEQQAESELAGYKYEREQEMQPLGATSDDALQSAHAELKTARARVKRLQAQIEQARSNLRADEARLGYTRIYAPMSGTVLSVDASEGQTLNAAYSTPTLLRLADLSLMTAWTRVSEADIGMLEPGMPVDFTTLSGDSRRWRSQVRQVLPSPEGKETDAVEAIQYTVLFDVDNTDRVLMPQMTAQAMFRVANANDVLTVPVSVLGDVGRSRAYYQLRVLNDAGQVVTREVEVGLRDRLVAQVLSGVGEGDTIVAGERNASGEQRLFQW